MVPYIRIFAYNRGYRKMIGTCFCRRSGALQKARGKSKAMQKIDTDNQSGGTGS